MDKRRSGTLIMVRTICCETVKETGVRCSNCPHRPENASAAQEFERVLCSQTGPGSYAPPACWTPAAAPASD